MYFIRSDRYRYQTDTGYRHIGCNLNYWGRMGNRTPTSDTPNLRCLVYNVTVAAVRLLTWHQNNNTAFNIICSPVLRMWFHILIQDIICPLLTWKLTVGSKSSLCSKCMFTQKGFQVLLENKKDFWSTGAILAESASKCHKRFEQRKQGLTVWLLQSSNKWKLKYAAVNRQTTN